MSLPVVGFVKIIVANSRGCFVFSSTTLPVILIWADKRMVLKE